jgi:hypothetical protein
MQKTSVVAGSLFQDAEARGSYHHSCITLQLSCTWSHVNMLRHQTVEYRQDDERHYTTDAPVCSSQVQPSTVAKYRHSFHACFWGYPRNFPGCGHSWAKNSLLTNPCSRLNNILGSLFGFYGSVLLMYRAYGWIRSNFCGRWRSSVFRSFRWFQSKVLWCLILFSSLLETDLNSSYINLVWSLKMMGRQCWSSCGESALDCAFFFLEWVSDQLDIETMTTICGLQIGLGMSSQPAFMQLPWILP